MENELKQHLKSRQAWLRGFYILLLAVFYSITEIVLSAVVLFQFLALLISGNTNERLLNFGQSLASYIYQIIQFMTANSEELPFPFNPWPEGPPPQDLEGSVSTTPADTPETTETHRQDDA